MGGGIKKGISLQTKKNRKADGSFLRVGQVIHQDCGDRGTQDLDTQKWMVGNRRSHLKKWMSSGNTIFFFRNLRRYQRWSPG